MAKSSNTWQKKLIAADRRAVRKIKGIKNRFAVDRETPAYDQKARVARADGLTVLPMKVDYKPRGFGKRYQNGSRMSASAREKVAAHSQARAAFFAGLKGV